MAREGSKLRKSEYPWVIQARGRAGGRAVAREHGPEHMAAIGRKGGERSGRTRREKAEAMSPGERGADLTVRLPAEEVAQLIAEAERCGTSRSALGGWIISDWLQEARET
jgi:general stress protein YciG